MRSVLWRSTVNRRIEYSVKYISTLYNTLLCASWALPSIIELFRYSGCSLYRKIPPTFTLCCRNTYTVNYIIQRNSRLFRIIYFILAVHSLFKKWKYKEKVPVPWIRPFLEHIRSLDTSVTWDRPFLETVRSLNNIHSLDRSVPWTHPFLLTVCSLNTSVPWNRPFLETVRSLKPSVP
jgi:hypothetical protein